MRTDCKSHALFSEHLPEHAGRLLGDVLLLNLLEAAQHPAAKGI